MVTGRGAVIGTKMSARRGPRLLFFPCRPAAIWPARVEYNKNSSGFLPLFSPPRHPPLFLSLFVPFLPVPYTLYLFSPASSFFSLLPIFLFLPLRGPRISPSRSVIGCSAAYTPLSWLPGRFLSFILCFSRSRLMQIWTRASQKSPCEDVYGRRLERGKRSMAFVYIGYSNRFGDEIIVYEVLHEICWIDLAR